MISTIEVLKSSIDDNFYDNNSVYNFSIFFWVWAICCSIQNIFCIANALFLLSKHIRAFIVTKCS